MAKFIEVTIGGPKSIIINTNEIMKVERTRSSDDKATIYLTSGDNYELKESYSTIKKWLEPDSHIVD